MRICAHISPADPDLVAVNVNRAANEMHDDCIDSQIAEDLEV
jgi:hypothetical protein